MQVHARSPVKDVADLWRIDVRLAQLGRGVGAMRLRIGEALCKLDARGGIQALGFPTLESYAREALGRSGRWGGDARVLARRLAGLPALRAALGSGTLTASMVELVARVATPEDEVAWVARARSMTVRAMRVLIRAERLAVLAEDDDRPALRSTITVTVDRIEAWAFERARAMVEAVGAARGDDAIEAMLAEGLGEILARDADVDLPSGICGDAGVDEVDSIGARAERAELALLRERGEAAAEAAVPPDVDVVEMAADEVDDGAPGDDVAELTEVDRRLRAVARELARRDVELAQLARLALDLELWRVLRFSSFDHYCRERIGLSPSSVATRIALARRMVALPEVEDALTTGSVGYEAATLVARVAGPITVGAWLERAAARTVKHLREEVDAVELVARVEGREVRREGPPDAELLANVYAVERAANGVVMGQVSGGEGEGGGEGGARVRVRARARARVRARAGCLRSNCGCRFRTRSRGSGVGWSGCTLMSRRTTSPLSRSSYGRSRRAGPGRWAARSPMRRSISATVGAALHPSADRAM